MAQIDFSIIGRFVTFFTPLVLLLVVLLVLSASLTVHVGLMHSASARFLAIKELSLIRPAAAEPFLAALAGADLLEQFVLKLGFFGSFFIFFALVTWLCFLSAPSRILKNIMNFVWGVGSDVYGAGLAAFNNIWVNFTAVFVFVAFSNFLGLLPFSFTITSSVVVPFFFSLTLFFACCYVMICGTKTDLFAGFLPAGTTTTIAPLIIAIEVVSNVAKFISLGVRLFANMFAGHLLLKVFYTMSYLIASSINLFLGFVGPFVFGFTGLIIILEVLIAALQAFVLLLLGVLYFKESEGYTLAH